MKRYAIVIVVMMAATMLGIGCGKKNEVNTADLQKSFQTADPATRSNVDKAVDAIKAGNYPEATTFLQKAAAQAKLTPEQRQAVQDVMTQIQKQMSEMAGKAGADAQKAAQDAKKSLPFGNK